MSNQWFVFLWEEICSDPRHEKCAHQLPGLRACLHATGKPTAISWGTAHAAFIGAVFQEGKHGAIPRGHHLKNTWEYFASSAADVGKGERRCVQESWKIAVCKCLPFSESTSVWWCPRAQPLPVGTPHIPSHYGTKVHFSPQALTAGAVQAAAARAQGIARSRARLQTKWIEREWFPQMEAGGNHQKQIKIKTTFQQETMEQM